MMCYIFGWVFFIICASVAAINIGISFLWYKQKDQSLSPLYPLYPAALFAATAIQTIPGYSTGFWNKYDIRSFVYGAIVAAFVCILAACGIARVVHNTNKNSAGKKV